MSSSREAILNKISRSLGNPVETEFKPKSGFDNTDYIIKSDTINKVDEFKKKLESLSGNVYVLEDKKEIYKTIKKIFKTTDSITFTGWDIEELSSIYATLEKSGHKYIKSTNKVMQAKCDIGITLADYGIAESGAIVLYNNKMQNRNCSLIVPIHIAILDRERITGNLFELINNISNDYSVLDSINDLSNCITLITGPSRTADIELNLTLGVHGPKELYVMIV